MTLPQEELENSIPSAQSASNPSSPAYGTPGDQRQDEAVVYLKSLLDEVDRTVRVRKDKMEQARRLSESDDISPALLNKAAQITAHSPTTKIEPAQFEELFTAYLRKYDDFLRAVDEDEENQRALLEKIKDTNDAFVNGRKSNALILKREKALQNLDQAYTRFKEIRTNLIEGIKVSCCLTYCKGYKINKYNSGAHESC
jgi:programmed cell death 6-interacting protein